MRLKYLDIPKEHKSIVTDIILAAWAITYAKDHYLAIYEEVCPADQRLREIVAACEEYLQKIAVHNETNPVKIKWNC